MYENSLIQCVMKFFANVDAIKKPLLFRSSNSYNDRKCQHRMGILFWLSKIKRVSKLVVLNLAGMEFIVFIAACIVLF